MTDNNTDIAKLKSLFNDGNRSLGSNFSAIIDFFNDNTVKDNGDGTIEVNGKSIDIEKLNDIDTSKFASIDMVSKIAQTAGSIKTRNLWEISNSVNGSLNKDTGEVIIYNPNDSNSRNSMVLDKYLETVNEKFVTVSIKGNTSISNVVVGYLAAYDANKKFISTFLTIPASASDYDVIATIPENTAYVRISLPWGNTGEEFVHFGNGVIDYSPAPADVITEQTNYGSENLINNSGYPTNIKHWDIQGEGATDKSTTFSVVTNDSYHNSRDNVFSLSTGVKLKTSAVSDAFSIIPNSSYSWQAKVVGNSSLDSVSIYLIYKNSAGQETVQPLIENEEVSTTKVQTIKGTFLAPTTGVTASLRIDNNGSSDSSSATLCFTEIQLSQEDKVSPWHPSANDILTSPIDPKDLVQKFIELSDNTDLFSLVINDMKPHYYLCGSTSSAKTLKNCPVDTAFSLETYPANTTQDVTTNSVPEWAYTQYVLRPFNTSDVWLASTNTDGDGNISSSSWEKLAKDTNVIHRDKDSGNVSELVNFPDNGLLIDNLPIIPILLAADKDSAITNSKNNKAFYLWPKD